MRKALERFIEIRLARVYVRKAKTIYNKCFPKCRTRIYTYIYVQMNTKEIRSNLIQSNRTQMYLLSFIINNKRCIELSRYFRYRDELIDQLKFDLRFNRSRVVINTRNKIFVRFSLSLSLFSYVCN